MHRELYDAENAKEYLANRVRNAWSLLDCDEQPVSAPNIENRSPKAFCRRSEEKPPSVRNSFRGSKDGEDARLPTNRCDG
jgi:hypothetical protein